MTGKATRLEKALQDKILAAVGNGFARQLEYTQALIRFASTRGCEHAIQDFVHDTWRSRNYAVERVWMDQAAIERHPGGSRFSASHSTAPLVIAHHRPVRETGQSLILQAHVDVVPAGPADLWTHPAFDPVIEGDWLYGRGGADMKAGHAANLAALDALRSIGLEPAGRICLQSVVEEESTGNGALMAHLAGYRADAVLIPEPEDEMLVRANVGVLWFEVEVRGHPVHVREMGSGANAIDAVYRVIGALRVLEEKWNADKTGRQHFHDAAHPINLNIGRIEGGDWASSVPAWCKIQCRIAIYPGVRAADAAAEIEECITAFARSDRFLANMPPRVTFNGFFAEGYVQPEGTQAEAVLGHAHQSAVGRPLESFMTAGYVDTRVFALYDQIPALCYGPVSRNIHGFDEAVSIASLQRITGTIALFIAEWCGVAPIEPAA